MIFNMNDPISCNYHALKGKFDICKRKSIKIADFFSRRESANMVLNVFYEEIKKL